MEDREGKHLQVRKSAGLIDVSIENDSLLMASDTDFRQVSGTSHADVALEMGQKSEKLPQLLESSEPERATKNVKCNLRKSLAWDSAFFTSAGVLDAEELSTMIEGGDKVAKHFLPGIQEDVRTSMDSISTLESDNLTLESLEADLFEDIRASIQKSSRASKMATLSSNAAQEGITPQPKASSTSKKVDIATGNRHIPKSSVKTTKSTMTGPGKMIKQCKNSPQVTQLAMKIRESTSSIPRPVKSVSNVNPMPSVTTKRASLSANHLNNNANSTSVLKGTQASKPPSLIGPRRGLPKSSSSSITSSLASSTASKTESMRPSSSCGSSGSSSDNVGKSATTSARRNLSKVNSSGPIPKNPSKAAPRCKISAPTAGPSSVHVISSKLSSNISPASSISEWSVESSSSTSTLNQTSTSRTSIDANSSCRSSNGDLDLNMHAADKTSDRNRNQRTELSSQTLKKAATQSNSLSGPDSMKPSGLRMPSPKIGFFDGSKAVRTPNGGVQSQARLSTGLPKLGSGLSPIGNSSKPKLGKLPPTKVVKASANLKPDSQCSISPIVSKELPCQLAKSTIASKDPKICPVKSPKVQPEVGESSCLQIEHERESGKLEIANNKINMQEIVGSEIVILSPKGEITDSTLDKRVAKIKPHGGVEDAIHGQDYLNMSPWETNEKAADQFGDQIDDLTKDFIAMDLQLAMQNKVAGNTSSCCERRCSNPCARELCSKPNFSYVLKEESACDLKEIVISPPEGDMTGSSFDACVGITKPNGVGGDAIHGQDDHKDKLSCGMKQMETDFEDQIDELVARDFFANDLRIALQKTIVDSTESYCELNCSISCAPELSCEQNSIDVQKEKPTADFKEIALPLQDGGMIDSSLDTRDGKIKPHGPGEDSIHEDGLKNNALGETNEKETDPFADIKPHVVDEDAIHGQDDLRNELFGETKETETDTFEDQLEELAAQDFFAMDLLIALQKAIADSTETYRELSFPDPCVPELGCEQNFINVQKEKPSLDYKEIVIPLQEGAGIIDSSLNECYGKMNPHGPDEDANYEDDLKNKALGETNEKETSPFGDIKPHGVEEYAVHGIDDHKNNLSGEMKEMEMDEDQLDDLAAGDFFAKDLQIALQKAIADEDAIHEDDLNNKALVETNETNPYGDIRPHEVVGDAIHGKDDHKNLLPGEMKEMETDPFEDQLDELAAQDIFAKDLQIALQKAIADRIESCCETIDNETNPFEVVEDAIHGHDDQRNLLSGEMKEMETDPFEDQIDDLASRDFFAIDLLIALQKAIADDQQEETLASTCENSNPDPCSPELRSEKNFIEVQEGPLPMSGKLSCLNSCALEICSEKKFLEIRNEEPAANSRTPLIEKNSLYSSKGLEIVTGSSIEAVEKTADLASSEISQKENSSSNVL